MIYRVYVAPRTYIEHTFVTARSAADTAQCVVPTVRWLVGNSSPLTFVFCQNTSCIPLEYTLYIAPFFLYTALFFRQIRPFLPWRARAASPECMLVYVQKTNIHSVTFWLSVSKHIKCRYVGCFQKFFLCVRSCRFPSSPLIASHTPLLRREGRAMVRFSRDFSEANPQLIVSDIDVFLFKWRWRPKRPLNWRK